MQDGDSANMRSGKRWKAAHRAVERRYRSNLNLKIIKLGQCIPAIRSQVGGMDDVEESQDGRTTAKAKLQKGHVLSEAVDYIQSLQQLVSDLETENKQLGNKVDELHLLVEDHHGPPEAHHVNWSPETPSRSLDPHPTMESESNKFSGMQRNGLGREMPSLEAQNALATDQSGFSFVSVNPSVASKRPRGGKGASSRV